jgi:hypothetical protein
VLALADVVERVKKITSGVGAYAAIDSVGGILTKVLTSNTREFEGPN